MKKRECRNKNRIHDAVGSVPLIRRNYGNEFDMCGARCPDLPKVNWTSPKTFKILDDFAAIGAFETRDSCNASLRGPVGIIP
jgi:hypothetical protein